jgi:hypothetical protein
MVRKSTSSWMSQRPILVYGAPPLKRLRHGRGFSILPSRVPIADYRKDRGCCRPSPAEQPCMNQPQEGDTTVAGTLDPNSLDRCHDQGAR